MKIIAATDFSPNALDAARSAARLARKLGDSLLLLRVIDPPTTSYPELGVVAPEILASLREASEAELRKIAPLLREEGVDVEERILVGTPAEKIAECAEKEKARLVVMGTHGRNGPARILLGSVAERTALQARCPVLVLRAGGAPFDEWIKGTRALRIVVGVDRSPASEAALAWVDELRKAGPCDLTLVHEYWPPAEYARLGIRPPRDLHESDPEIVAVLERELGERVLRQTGKGDARLIVRGTWGRIVDSLVLDARADRADLLVVGTHQPHGWDRVKEGSMALATLRAARVPVLCVPAVSVATDLRRDHEVPVLRSVLAATDLSDLGNAAVRHAYSLLRGAGGTVELCHIHERHIPTPAYAYDDKDGALSSEQQGKLEAELRALIPAEAESFGITTRLHIIDRGTTAQAVLQAAERLDSDAIVLGSHGRTGLARTVLGSVAEAVMRGSERPVYVVRKAAK